MHANPILNYALATHPVDPELLRVATSSVGSMAADEAGRACACVEEAADGGSAFAMCLCVLFAENGWGQPRSAERALFWARSAAQAGYPPGHFLLAQIHEHGRGVEVDISAAIENYIRASRGKRGFAPAATRLAEIFSQRDTSKFCNVARAKRNAYRGYLLGDPLSAMLLGSWYESGWPTERDNAKALGWYEASSAMGNFLTSERLSRVFELGELGAERNPEKSNRYIELFWSQVQPPPAP